MNFDELQNQASNIIKLAKNIGLDHAEVIIDSNESFTIDSQNENISKLTGSADAIFGIRTEKNNQIGISYSESFEKNAIEETIHSAINNSKYVKSDKYESISIEEKPYIQDYSESFIEDNTELSTKKDFLIKMEQGLKEASTKFETKVPYNALGSSFRSRIIANSLGTQSLYKSQTHYCYTSALLSKTNKQSMFYEKSLARKFSDLDSQKCINTSVELAENFMTAKPIKTGKYNVIFNLDTFSSLFHCFGSIFSAESARKKVNPLADKLGELIAHPELSITDDGTYKHGFSKSDFDSEGKLRTPLALIKNGKFENMIHNSTTANYFNAKNTAHASRGPKSSLDVSLTQIIISKGQSDSSEIYKNQTLEIIKIAGLHSGASVISGNFSFGAHGILREDGEVKQYVDGITVSGNFYELLKNISAIGNELKHDTDKHFFSPEIVFSNVSIAGS